MAYVANSSSLRIKNEKKIISLIHREPLSRTEIAKMTGLTKAAVTIIVEELIRRGTVTEERCGISKELSRGAGRTPILLRLCGDSIYFAGINIKRTGIGIGLCNLCGDIVFEDYTDICEPGKAIPAICGILRENIGKYGIPSEKICGISVVTPGPVDTENGVILNPPNFRQWHGVNICREFAAFTDIPVTLTNVSSAYAAAEKYFGAAKKRGSFMTLLTDEGIGAGIMTGDSLFKGSCEIGHITVKYDGEKCECGNIGCLEKYASIPNILKGTRYKSWSECIAAGDTGIINREADYLSSAIVTVTNIFNLDCAVLCGETAVGSADFISAVRKKTLEKMILKKDFEILTGIVSSFTLIPCAIGVHNFLNPNSDNYL